MTDLNALRINQQLPKGVPFVCGNYDLNALLIMAQEKIAHLTAILIMAQEKVAHLEGLLNCKEEINREKIAELMEQDAMATGHIFTDAADVFMRLAKSRKQELESVKNDRDNLQGENDRLRDQIRLTESRGTP